MVLDLKRAPSGQTIVKPTALGPVANTDTKLLIYGLFQSGRVLAQDGVASIVNPDAILGWHRRLVAKKFDSSKNRLYPGRPQGFLLSHSKPRALP